MKKMCDIIKKWLNLNNREPWNSVYDKEKN